MKNREIRDITRCVEQARLLADRLANIHRQEQALCRAFTSLAGDETIGLMAYVIWRAGIFDLSLS